jgi:predicted nucleotidyltransferase
MTPEQYQAFTDALVKRLADDERVLGLVALGSMARRDYEPDEWSDHDFFVVTREGEQEWFRADPSWLPDASRLVLHFRETEHGVKALYASGHLVELAVFDPRELGLARVNRCRVLLDRGGVEARAGEVARATAAALDAAREPDERLFGQFVTNLLVGVGRDRRGERLSGAQFVKGHAVRHLLVLLARHVPSARSGLLDDLDPFRRFELAHPGLAVEISAATAAATPDAASALLALAGRALSGVPGYPEAAVRAVADRLSTAPLA